MIDDLQGFSSEQKAKIAELLPVYFETELAKWMGQHADKAESHKLVKYPDDAIETGKGVTFRQRYVLLPVENISAGMTLLPFEVEAASYPHTTLSVTIERTDTP